MWPHSTYTELRGFFGDPPGHLTQWTLLGSGFDWISTSRRPRTHLPIDQRRGVGGGLSPGRDPIRRPLEQKFNPVKRRRSTTVALNPCPSSYSSPHAAGDPICVCQSGRCRCWRGSHGNRYTNNNNSVEYVSHFQVANQKECSRQWVAGPESSESSPSANVPIGYDEEEWGRGPLSGLFLSGIFEFIRSETIQAWNKCWKALKCLPNSSFTTTSSPLVLPSSLVVLLSTDRQTDRLDRLDGSGKDSFPASERTKRSLWKQCAPVSRAKHIPTSGHKSYCCCCFCWDNDNEKEGGGVEVDGGGGGSPRVGWRASKPHSAINARILLRRRGSSVASLPPPPTLEIHIHVSFSLLLCCSWGT